MPRWSQKEQDCLNYLRQHLAKDLQEIPSYPEVVGDRKLIRFLRGHDYNCDKIIELYRNFLKWRKDNNVNEIRNQIIYHGYDHPLKFPKGEIILPIIKQIVIAPDATDKYNSPICLEQYNFSPSDILDKITLDDYVTFMIYCLEYRSIVLEQISEEREQEYLEALPKDLRIKVNTSECSLKPYGQIANMCVIRDLSGVGWEHLSSRGLEIIRVIVTIASNNYPELMRKCFMINVPWVFNTVWYFVKGLLAERTIQKISVMGSGFMKEIQEDVELSNIPALVGGKYIGYAQYQSFPFDREYFSSSVASTVMSPGVAAGSSSLFPEESTSLTSSQKAEKENEQLIIDISRDDDIPLYYHPAHPHPHHVAVVSSTAPSSADNSPAPSTQDLLAGQPAPVQSQQTGEEGGGTRDSSSSSLDFPLISLQTSGY